MEHRSLQLVNKVVIEIDGVRHLLVEVDPELRSVCSHCSMHDYCVETPNCYCYLHGIETKKTMFVLENGNTD